VLELWQDYKVTVEPASVGVPKTVYYALHSNRTYKCVRNSAPV